MKKISQTIKNSLALVPPAFAQAAPAEPTIAFKDPWGGLLENIKAANIVGAVVKFALIAAAIVAFAFLIYGGIKWITSSGDKEATASAQGTITAAVIGLAIVFAAWALMSLIQTFFGIDILGGLNIPTVQPT